MLFNTNISCCSTETYHVVQQEDVVEVRGEAKIKGEVNPGHKWIPYVSGKL
jgi:hypothetical protein